MARATSGNSTRLASLEKAIEHLAKAVGTQAGHLERCERLIYAMLFDGGADLRKRIGARLEATQALTSVADLIGGLPEPPKSAKVAKKSKESA